MAKTTQDKRYLQLTTPLGKDVLLIHRLRCQEDISKLFRIELDLLHDEETAGFVPTYVDPQKVIGNPMTVSAHQVNNIERYFHGICVRFSQGGRNGRFSEYKAELVPKVWMLTQVHRSRIWQDKTVKQILEEVLEGYEFTDDIRGEWLPRNYIVQYRESDWDFISRLMEEEGIFYFFEHTKNGHTLILGNEPPTNVMLTSKPVIPCVLDRGELKDNWIPSIITWRSDDQMRNGTYELRDFHFQLPKSTLEATQTSLLNIGKNQTLEYYDYPGEYAKRFDRIDIGGAEDEEKLKKVFEDRRRTVKIRQEEVDVAYHNFYATSDQCSITAGYRFEMQKHPRKENNGQYVITSAQHEGLQSPSYISDNDVPNGYVVSFVCMPHGAGHPPFRPMRLTPKPVVRGCQTAMVVGKPGEEITTDKYGRVKVHFHWDRADTNDLRGSCWLRVATNFAGNKWGTMYLPRIGQEVMVDFLEGDPDRPIIVGGVYNEQTMPHYDLPKYKTLTYIKTHSTPGGNGFNELRFEDKKDKEQVFVHSQKRYDLRVRGSMYETCGGNRQEVIGMRSDDKQGGNLACSVGGEHDLHIKFDDYVDVEKKRYEIVAEDVLEGYKGKKITIIKGKSEQNAQEIILEATTKISLKVGMNCIVIDQSGVTIAGQMVKINSGGFGTETSNPDIGHALDAEYSDNGEPGYLDRPRKGGGGKGRRWETFKSQHYVAPPRKDEDPKMTAIRNALKDTPTGRHALEVYDRNNVKSTFNTGVGGGFQQSTNTMNLDPAWGDFNNTAFVHEMNHAESAHDGTKPDINNPSKADYVDGMMKEESKGDALANQASKELAANGTPQTNNPPNKPSYDAGYAKGVADAKAANPNASPEELDAAGQKEGQKAVYDDYKAGKVTPSDIDGKKQPPYPDYYGNAWDKAHPKKP